MATQSGTNNTDVKNWVPCGAGLGLPPASAGASAGRAPLDWMRPFCAPEPPCVNMRTCGLTEASPKLPLSNRERSF